MGEEEKKGFVVKDKRIFDDSGEKRASEDIAEEPVQQPASKTTAESENIGTAGATADDESEADYQPEVNFYNFIVSLSTTALFHLGDFADPDAGRVEKNLPAAKQIIDTLAMLRDKTAGNRDENESALIDGALYELRMRYVKETA